MDEEGLTDDERDGVTGDDEGVGAPGAKGRDAPALMLLGAADMRVPHGQGREWVAALQQRRAAQVDSAEVLALEFPGEGHAIASVEGNAHAVETVRLPPGFIVLK